MDQHDVSRYSKIVSHSLTFHVMLFYSSRKAELPRQGMQVCVVRPMSYGADNERIYLWSSLSVAFNNTINITGPQKEQLKKAVVFKTVADIFEANYFWCAIVVSVISVFLRTELFAPDSLQFVSKVELRKKQWIGNFRTFRLQMN